MTTVNGLPAHVLLVHAVVVLVPLCAVLLVLAAVWPAARRRLAVPTAVLAALALVSVPLATDAGEWLERRVPNSEIVRTHTELGDTMLPWAIGLFVLAVAVAVRHVLAVRAAKPAGGPGAAHSPAGRRTGHGPGGAAATVVVAVLCVAVGIGSVVTVYRIGDSGARAAWTGQFSQQAQPRTDAAPAVDDD